MNRRTLVVAGGVIVLGVLAVVLWHKRGASVFLSAKVTQGQIRDAVDATGTVNAVTTVLVGSQVSGTIAKLNADFNSRVHRGDVIALIDPSLLQGAMQQATADLESAQAAVTAAVADSEKAAAAFVQARADYNRFVALDSSHSVTQQEVDQAKATYEAATATLHGATASVVQGRALVSQKTAALSVARTNLDHTVIRSPIDGIVVARNVDLGQTVAASLQAPTLFTIAQDLTKMQVYAKVDESDVGRIRVGQPSVFKVDAFPKDAFRGVVSQIRLNATTVQNVVTYDVIIDFANPEMKLFPGMTAYVTIPVAIADNVTKVPNTALHYAPPLSSEVRQALLAKFGITETVVPGAGSHVGRDADPERRNQTKLGARSGMGTSGSEEQGTAIAIIWKLHADQSIEPVQVALGITDHAYTQVIEVVKGALRPGDDVVIGSLAAGTAPRGSGGR